MSCSDKIARWNVLGTSYHAFLSIPIFPSLPNLPYHLLAFLYTNIDTRLCVSLMSFDLGLQGSLLTHIIDPIYLASLTVADYHHSPSLKRAIIDRISTVSVTPPFKINSPQLFDSNIVFIRGKVAMEKAGVKLSTSANG